MIRYLGLLTSCLLATASATTPRSALLAPPPPLDGTLAPVPNANPDPFVGQKFYIDPNSSAQNQIQAWQNDHPDWAEALKAIADHSQADWFLEPLARVKQAVSRRVTLMKNDGSLPVMVAYNMLQRDCDSHSKGGAASADEYRSWIRAFADGIGKRKAVVILEPDALADIDTADCLSPADKQTRLALLRDAVAVLKANPATAVYIDAGNSRWLLSPRAAELLNQAGIDQADGFALNVSNFETTEESIQYGVEIARRVGNKHFIVDTSRNGRGPALNDDWCNPPDRGLGTPPTVRTANALCDAYVWVKSPGESDGEGSECHDGPDAGVWWPEYALRLAQLATSDPLPSTRQRPGDGLSMEAEKR